MGDGTGELDDEGAGGLVNLLGAGSAPGHQERDHHFTGNRPEGDLLGHSMERGAPGCDEPLHQMATGPGDEEADPGVAEEGPVPRTL